MNKKRALLPWYLNKTLSERETLNVESWLEHNPDANTYHDSIKSIAGSIRNQKEFSPSHQVQAKIISEIQQPARQPGTLSQWLWSVPLAAIIFALLWLTIQPGNQLQWSVRGSEPAAFRIYRAPVGNTTFELIDEIDAIPTQHSYKFADPVVLPGQNYHYAVESVDQYGNTSISQVASSNSMMVLATQFAILLTSLMLTFGMITIAQEFPSPLQLSINL